ncbi:hypothetical protein VP01_2596g1 [Puccinia sorghi]|uniref:Uncharacterized protein n=1 Tax=Puccinia sorghi TaxID=27349 RepID=A0A0L6V4Q5_9BASI|nr:hypothetical protein VP01_2596g1 [Puccinia sorghi]
MSKLHTILRASYNANKHGLRSTLTDTGLFGMHVVMDISRVVSKTPAPLIGGLCGCSVAFNVWPHEIEGCICPFNQCPHAKNGTSVTLVDMLIVQECFLLTAHLKPPPITYLHFLVWEPKFPSLPIFFVFFFSFDFTKQNIGGDDLNCPAYSVDGHDVPRLPTVHRISRMRATFETRLRPFRKSCESCGVDLSCKSFEKEIKKYSHFGFLYLSRHKVRISQKSPPGASRPLGALCVIKLASFTSVYDDTYLDSFAAALPVPRKQKHVHEQKLGQTDLVSGLASAGHRKKKHPPQKIIFNMIRFGAHHMYPHTEPLRLDSCNRHCCWQGRYLSHPREIPIDVSFGFDLENKVCKERNEGSWRSEEGFLRPSLHPPARPHIAQTLSNGPSHPIAANSNAAYNNRPCRHSSSVRMMQYCAAIHWRCLMVAPSSHHSAAGSYELVSLSSNVSELALNWPRIVCFLSTRMYTAEYQHERERGPSLPPDDGGRQLNYISACACFFRYYVCARRRGFHGDRLDAVLHPHYKSERVSLHDMGQKEKKKKEVWRHSQTDGHHEEAAHVRANPPLQKKKKKQRKRIGTRPDLIRDRLEYKYTLVGTLCFSGIRNTGVGPTLNPMMNRTLWWLWNRTILTAHQCVWMTLASTWTSMPGNPPPSLTPLWIGIAHTLTRIIVRSSSRGRLWWREGQRTMRTSIFSSIGEVHISLGQEPSKSLEAEKIISWPVYLSDQVDTEGRKLGIGAALEPFRGDARQRARDRPRLRTFSGLISSNGTEKKKVRNAKKKKKVCRSTIHVALKGQLSLLYSLLARKQEAVLYFKNKTKKRERERSKKMSYQRVSLSDPGDWWGCADFRVITTSQRTKDVSERLAKRNTQPLHPELGTT